MTEYYAIGEEHADLDPSLLLTEKARLTYDACLRNTDFELHEIRQQFLGGSSAADIIVVTCCNDQVPSRNTVGIKVREKLALVFDEDPAREPKVKALRKSFPVVPHLNDTSPNEPAWLCIYFESWSSVRRSWTPQKYLQRILWWLTETAKGSLHRSDQPVERIYFDSPYEVVLPPEFDDKIGDPELSFVMQSVPIAPGGEFKVARGKFIKINQISAEEKLKELCPIILTLDAIVHGVREKYPKNLGELNDQIVKRGSEFFTKLQDGIKELVDSNGVKAPFGKALLIIRFPLQRYEGTEVEEFEIRAFGVEEEFSRLGVVTGSLIKNTSDGMFYRDYPVGDTSRCMAPDDWRTVQLLTITIKKSNTHTFVQLASGINADTADFSGVIGGVGALGGVLIDIWSKEAWGRWCLIDDDILRAHNVLRHIGKDVFIGNYKSEVVANLAGFNYSPGYHKVNSLRGSVSDSTNNDNIKEMVSRSDLLVDATTTLDAPRDLSQLEYVPRSVSVFLTPSGKTSVLLFEDSERRIKLDCLEAQYYRGVINSDWGENHLKGHLGNISVGAGCRDISVVMSYEAIQLHAAIVAKQIRLLRDQSKPCVRVWIEEAEFGNVECVNISVAEVIQEVYGNWRVVTDEDLNKKLKKMRMDGLPNETGGVIIGYIDQVIQTIYVVDVLPAPSDSESTGTGFVRGIDGLVDTLEEISDRTAKIVQYIGEWHSHPPFASTQPSSLDKILLQKLADKLATDGLPALMMIIGSDGAVGISVKMS